MVSIETNRGKHTLTDNVRHNVVNICMTAKVKFLGNNTKYTVFKEDII